MPRDLEFAAAVPAAPMLTELPHAPRNELLDPRERARGRAMLWLTLALIAGVLLWLWIGQMKSVTAVSGKIVPADGARTVQPFQGAVVKAVHVREGDRVNAGDVLVELDPTATQTRLASTREKELRVRFELARLQAELSGAAPIYPQADGDAVLALREAQEALRQARLAEFASQRKDAEAEIGRQGAALAVANEEVNRAQQLRAVAAEREVAYRELAKTGMVSRQGYLPHWQDLVDAESTQRVRRQELRRASDEVPRARTRLETLVESRRARLLADISERTAEQAALEHDLVRLTQENDLQILRAPVSGTVQSILAVSPGSVVPAAQPIVSVVPDGAVLTVEAFIPPGEVGFLKPGQAVEVKVDAYPFERYGTLPGTLEWVSPDAEASDRDPINRLARVPAPNGVTGYRARIQLRRETLGTNSTELAVRPGMTVRAEIQTDQRRIVDYLLAPVLRRLDEGTKGS